MSASPEDLEDGELPSSDEDNDGIVNAKLSKTDSPSSPNNHSPAVGGIDTDKEATDSEATRKRPFESPEPENVEKDEGSSKKPRLESSDISDLEDGEIYSDDEEAAYYPQLVKSRISEHSSRNKDKARERRRTPPRKYRRSHSRSPVSRDNRHHRPNHEKSDRLNADRGKTYSPARNSRGPKSGWRDRNSSVRNRGRSRGYNHSGNNLVGQPIRHDRPEQTGNASHMWDGYQYSSNHFPVLTLQELESRLKQGLAILPTPNINSCDTLDEFNYPAMPQWYQKAVNAYNKRMGYSRGGMAGGGAWKGAQQTDEMVRMDVVVENLGYNVPPPPLPPLTKPTPLFGNDEPLNIVPVQPALPPTVSATVETVPQQQPVGLAPSEPVIKPLFDSETPESLPKAEEEPKTTPKDAQYERSLSEPSGLSIQIDDQESDEEDNQAILSDITPVDSPFTEEKVPSTSTLATENSEDSKPSLTVTTLYTQSVGKKGRGNSKSRLSKRPSRQPRAPKKLIVSIDLKMVHVRSDDSLEVMTPSEEEFNYDDYLDQLNDEEEEDKTMASFDSCFWIDTNPRSASKSNTNSVSSSSTSEPAPLLDNPLDEDFPTLDGSSSTTDVKSSGGPSLRSLVEKQSVDTMLMVEEGKQDSRGGGGGKKKKRKHLISNLKQLEKSYWTKQEKRGKSEQPSSKPTPDQETETRPSQQEQQQMQPQQQPNQSQAPLLPNPPPDTPSGQKLAQPCKYYLQGYCIHGDNCQYNHAVAREKKREMCKFYLQDACDKGDSCIFYHGDFPCKYFHARHMCYHGDKCKFSHAPLTLEGYDLLMGVLEPNLRDQVCYPGHQQPADIQNQPLLPIPVPTPIPNPAVPQPGLHPGLLGPAPSVIPDPALQMRDQPINCPQPLGSPPPPQTTNFPQTGGLSPNYRYPVAEQPMDPRSNSHPQTHSAGMMIIPSRQEDDPSPSVTCNIPLPPGFDVDSLFPDEHPQVLPHDLATKLRDVLLETPSSTSEKDKKQQEEEERFELFYWENVSRSDSQPSEPNDHRTVGLHSDLTYSTEQQHTYETIPPYPSGNYQRPSATPPVLPPNPVNAVPQTQRDTRMHPADHTPSMISLQSSPPPRPDGDVAHFRSHLEQDVRGGTYAPPDPRRTYLSTGSQKQVPSRMSPDPRQDPRFVKKEQPVSSTSPRSFENSRPSSQSFPADQPQASFGPQSIYSSSNSSLVSSYTTDTIRKPMSATDISDYSIPKSSAPQDTPPRPAWGGGANDSSGSVLKSSDRLVDPRKKYAHLKIKSKSSLPPLTETQKKSSTSDLPELLRDSSILDKPIDPKDLFGTYSGGISLFGSGSQVGGDSETNEFGEIKMQDTTNTDEPDESRDSEKSKRTVAEEEGGEEAVPVIPSYLTHLNLGITDDEEDDSLKIDSAFGSLQARRRRLSEQTTPLDNTVSEDSNMNKDPPTSKISGMFSFGSSLY